MVCDDGYYKNDSATLEQLSACSSQLQGSQHVSTVAHGGCRGGAKADFASIHPRKWVVFVPSVMLAADPRPHAPTPAR